MSGFILACAGLIVLSCFFCLLPALRSTRSADDNVAANLDWYRLRGTELLGEDDEALRRDTQLRLLEDDNQSLDSAGPLPAGQRFPRWLLLPPIAVVAVALYYQLGAAPDVLIRDQLQSLTQASGPGTRQELLQAIESRSSQRPDNLHYTSLLARFSMENQDYERAATLYSELALAAPGDAQLLASAAQAQYLAGGRVLNEVASANAMKSLAIDPHQRTALGVLGMASFEQQQYAEAIGYWQRLIAMEPEGSASARMIADVIERARQNLAAGGEGLAATPRPDPVAAVTRGVTVRVSFPAGAQVGASDTVFVLARGASSSSRMPVAVHRLQASQLPATIRLDDSKSMAGQKLSALESIIVLVQVSPDGRPGEASASWLGRAGPLVPSLDTAPLKIELAPAQG